MGPRNDASHTPRLKLVRLLEERLEVDATDYWYVLALSPSLYFQAPLVFHSGVINENVYD